MKLKIDLIIFDFDGVIVNSGLDIANAVNYTLKFFKRPELPTDEIISYVGGGAQNLLERSFKGCDNGLVLKALPVYKEYYLNNCIVDTVLYNNVKETLEYFKDKKLSVVTNKPEDLTLKILEGLHVLQYFKLIVGPESVKNMKPDPEGLTTVIMELGAKPEKTIMIGDSHTDIQAGKNAGTYTCGVTYGLGSSEKLVKSLPDIILDNIYKLTEFII